MSITMGKWTVYALETGDFRLDGGAMMGSVPKVLWEKTNPADHLNRIRLSLRCMLLDDGENRILVESGMGGKLSVKFKEMFHVIQTNAPLIDALKRAGFDKRDITHVILTHLHFDHSGGATDLDDNGSIIPTFPQANYFISRRNWNAGMHPNPRDRASYLPENYASLESTGRLMLLEDNTTILDGISTITVDGHTTGQALVKVQDSGQTLVFVADLVPLKSHLKLPWIMGYDLSAELTLVEKTDFLRQACIGNWWLWFYHDPETVMVKIRRDEKYYTVTREVRRKEGQILS